MRALMMQTDFSGGMNLQPASDWAANEVLYAVNVNLRNRKWVGRGGCHKLFASALNGVGTGSFTGLEGWGIFRYKVGHWIAFFGGTAYKSTDYGASWSALAGATGLREDYWFAVTMTWGGTDYIVFANGGSASYKYDGATWSALANIPSGARFLAVINQRLAAATGEDGTLYLSKIDDAETWAAPDGIVLPIQTNDGGDLTGLVTMAQGLVVFKSNSMNLVEGYGNSDIIVAAGPRGISRDIGCVCPRTIVPVSGGRLMWMSDRGIELYTPGAGITWVNQYKHPISRATEQSMGTLGLYPYAVYNPDRDEYHIARPYTFAGPTCDQRLIVFLPTLAMWKHSVGGATAITRSISGMVAERSSAAIYQDFIEATRTGYVRRYDGEDVGDYKDDLDSNLFTNGTTFTARVVTRPMFFKEPMRQKRARRFRYAATVQHATRIDSAKIIVDPQWDGDFVRSLASSTAVNLNTFTASNTTPEYTSWQGISVRGRSFALDWSSSDLNANGVPTLWAAEIEAEPMMGIRR